MATTNAIADASPTDTIASKLRDYYTLTKPEVNLLLQKRAARWGNFGNAGRNGTLGAIERQSARRQGGIS
jgi:hypothetical protein